MQINTNTRREGNDLWDNSSFREARMNQLEGMEVTAGVFNLIIGGVLLWGLFVDFLIAHFLGTAILQMNFIVMIILYFAATLGGKFITYRFQNPAISFAGFTLMAAGFGLIITYVVQGYTSSTIVLALTITAMVTAIMMIAGMLFPAFFFKISRTLFLALAAVLVVSLITALMGFRLGILDYVVIAIFCGYIGFDWARAQQYPKNVDNAIDSAADIFMDIVNIFIRVLSIIGKSKKN